MVDIDLLVPRQQLSQALSALQSLGYHPLYLPHSEADYHDIHALTLVDKTSGGSIDLHWTLLPPATPFTIPIEQIWQSARQDPSRKPNILALIPEELLLHLCLHAVYLDHFSSGLRPFCDIAWTVNALQDQIDWQLFVLRAGQWGAARSAWLALMVAGRLLHAPVPVELLDRLHLPVEDDMTRVDWAIAQVLKPVEMGGKLAAVWAPNPWRRRAVLFAHLLFPSTYEMRIVEPRLARGLLWPLAYLRHLGLVIRRNWGAAWKLVRGESRIRAAAIRSEQVNKLVQWQESRPQ